MNKWPVLLLLGLPSVGLAAEAYLMGQGQVLSSPDYVELQIHVQSKCYSTPEDARKYNDKAARDIVDSLNKKLKGKGHYNKVITHGGYTQSYQTYHRNQVLCENTFQKNNRIIFRTQEVDGFEVLFDDIQKEVYKHFETQPRGLIESSVTYVTLSSPNPMVSQERRNTLEREAMTMALKDAKSKLQALFTDQPIQNLKITEVSEYRPEPPRPMPMMESARMMAMDAGGAKSAPAPVQFDEQWIHKTVYFRFNFDDVALP